MKKIFIDGQEGTTGLQIVGRLEIRQASGDIEILKIPAEKRKNIKEREKYINDADIVFLCLPDDAAREAVNLVKNENVKIIDASTAHRTNSNWAYGFPELSQNQFGKIKNSKRVSVPGCYASGFVALLAPLVARGIVATHYPIFTYGISGYSGAGNKAIAQYEDPNRNPELDSPRLYALGLGHKHLPEMKMYSGLAYNPMFTPIINDYYNGMIVTIPLQSRLLSKRTSRTAILDILSMHYSGANFIKVIQNNEDISSLFLAANTLADTNSMEIRVLGNDEQILLVARFDNLGKGASGAAVQCMNIMLGIDETTGLI